VQEDELATVPGRVRELLDDPERLQRMGAAMAAAARPDAAAAARSARVPCLRSAKE
jgi:UDP-N-acetylglucosamine:LPS N-acetylglucosamine transferase